MFHNICVDQLLLNQTPITINVTINDNTNNIVINTFCQQSSENNSILRLMCNTIQIIIISTINTENKSCPVIINNLRVLHLNHCRI